MSATFRIRKPRDADYKLRLRVDCTKLGLPDPQEEVRFAEGRKWRFDFAWPADRVAIEIQGGGFMRPLYFYPATQTHHLRPVPGARCVTVKLKNGKSYVPRLGGEHSNAAKLCDEYAKFCEAQLLGWRVFLLSTKQIARNEHLPLLQRLAGLIVKTPKGRLF